ncbi:MAG: TRAP transporter substrate-binding protein DctP [Emcibacteraceae bacterium]|nr:TRAP transporter substrate-binding protein DctP [Emcibacteraceae bacterium]
MDDRSRLKTLGGWVLFIIPMLFGLYFFLLSTSSTEVDNDAPVTLIAGAFAAPGTPWDADWQIFNKNLMAANETGSNFDVKLLIRGEVGGEPISMTNVRRNRIQFGGFTIGGGSAVIPEMSVLLSPYVFDSFEEVDYVMDNHMLDVFQPLFAEKGMVLLRWVEVGWAHMYARDPLILPQDANGFRLRTQASEAAQVMMLSLGGDIHQMEVGDVIPSLQTGLIQGGETNVVIYAFTGLSSEAHHLTLTQHSYDSGVLVANKEWFDSLSPVDQEQVINAFPASDESRASVRIMSDGLLANLRSDEAISVYDLDDAQKAAWKEATKDNYKQIIAEIGGRSQEIYDAMIEGRREYRRRVSNEDAP